MIFLIEILIVNSNITINTNITNEHFNFNLFGTEY